MVCAQVAVDTLAAQIVFSKRETACALAETGDIFLIEWTFFNALAAMLTAESQTHFSRVSTNSSLHLPVTTLWSTSWWVIPLLADVLSRLGLVSAHCVREVLVPLKSERVAVAPSTCLFFSASSRAGSTLILHCGSQQRKPKDVLCMVSTRTCFNCARGIVAWFLFEVV